MWQVIDGVRTAFSFVVVIGLFLVLSRTAAREPHLGLNQEEPGILRVSVLDAATSELTPARLEVLDQAGKSHIAEDGIQVGTDWLDREKPWEGSVEDALSLLSPKVRNPYSGTHQFYTRGRARLQLPPGVYELKVVKGIEYRVVQRKIVIEAGKISEEEVRLTRWIDLPGKGWYGADGHLHIQRPHPELNPLIAKWMQAEDIHVGNLLQWGNLYRFHSSIQYALGKEGIYREGDTIVAAGQENPRTHFLGHTIILGASSAIHFPERYVIYRLFWEEARRQGALSGYAHGGFDLGAINGISIDLPEGLVDFVEVLQWGRGKYKTWYDILNTGFRMTPIAGTDYPVGPSLPGRELFYTKVEGPLSYQSWLEGIRKGRTFVTNGPVLELQVSGQEMGESLVLAEPGTVTLEGAVRFDPQRDDVTRLEVIQNGEILRTFYREEDRAEITCGFEHRVSEAAWFALRSYGTKRLDKHPFPSLAHTAPVYVEVKGAPKLAEGPKARALARAWIARLDTLENQVLPEIQTLGDSKIVVAPDRVDVEHLIRNRSELLEAIRSARKYFEKQAR